MRLKVFFPLILCVLVAAIVTPARFRSQQDGKSVIDEFIRTRGSDFAPREKAGKPKKNRTAPRRAPKSVPKKPASNGKPVEVNAPSKQDSETKAETEAAIVPDNSFPSGLGYTIFKRNRDTDELVAVGANHVFKEGDELRLSLETNADGYLYIFNTENDSKPDMLYPNVTLDNGRNEVSAHTSELYPADGPFVIEGKEAVEHLHIIFSRTPLPDVPTGDALLKVCAANLDDCDWYPSSAQWASIKSLGAGAPVNEGNNGELARVELRVPGKSLTRRIRIKPKAPGPAVVRLSASPTTDVLLTTIEIIHK